MGSIMKDALSEAYSRLLDGTYSCVDRIVLNGYCGLAHSPAGFRHLWRQLHGSDADLDNAHLMRMAGRFSRRVRAFAQARKIPLMDCAQGEDKHLIAEAHLAQHPDVRGLFLILVARAVAPVWDIQRSKKGVLLNIASKRAYVNHYSFHIWDPEWGHITIKLSGHPPFPAQIILNGHEFVARQASRQGLVFGKEDNCFTSIANATDLQKVADTLSDPRIIGRLTQVWERWIYTSCL